MKKTIYIFVISSCLTILATHTGHSQEGALDFSFGINGKVTTAVGDSDDFGTAVAIQNDGKILVAGGSSNGITLDFALVRYNSNGTLDNSFVGDGKATTDFGFGNSGQGTSIAIQDDGKIIVAGYSFIGISKYFTLIRYKSNGSLDNTFGEDGIVTTSFGEYGSIGHSVAIQNDGKIVVAGSSENSSVNSDLALVRYNIDGSLDETFDVDGIVTTDFGGYEDVGLSVAIQDDGKIVVAGSSSKCCTYTISDFVLVRYNTDGSLDSAFDEDGKVTTDFDSLYDDASAVIIQSDGKIVLVGNGHNLSNTYSDIELIRYNSDGSLDDSFDFDGQVSTNFDSLYGGVSAVAIQNDGKIVLAGSISTSSYTLFDFAVVRYEIDGSLDDNFGSGGMVNTEIGNYYSGASSVAIQDDGKIVVAGTSKNDFDNFTDFALVRYNSGTVGIAEKSVEKSLLIFPIPFNNELVIKGTNENVEILIFDVIGNEMLRQKSFEAETKINTEKLLPGYYFLLCTDGKNMTNTKLVKL